VQCDTCEIAEGLYQYMAVDNGIQLLSVHILQRQGFMASGQHR
jgi:hypothetical protein